MLVVGLMLFACLRALANDYVPYSSLQGTAVLVETSTSEEVVQISRSGEPLHVTVDGVADAYGQGSYRNFAGSATTTGRVLPQGGYDGSLAEFDLRTYDSLQINGGSGRGVATIEIHWAQAVTADLAANFFVGAYATFAFGVADWSDGAGKMVAGATIGSGLTNPEGFSDYTTCAPFLCTFDPGTGTMLVPFAFEYGGYIGLNTQFSVYGSKGGSASGIGSLSILLPPGATVTSNSGTDYAAVTAVPEPRSLYLMLIGLGAAAFKARQRSTE